MQKYLVFYSGGICSYAATKRLLETVPKEHVSLVFTDTKTEDQDLYRFLVESSNVLDIPLVWLADGRNIWQVMNDERFLGNTLVDPCSKILKRQLSDRYVQKHFNPEEIVRVYGMDWSESDRAKRLAERLPQYECLFPLCEKPYLPYERYFDMLREDGIPPPRLYKYGFTHNNCGGFCIKAGKGQFRKLYKAFPERYLAHEAQEQALIAKLGSSKKLGLIRHQVKGVKHYITLREFREMEESANDYEDVGICGCFAA